MNRQDFLHTIQQSLQTTLLPEARPDSPAPPSLDPFNSADWVEAFIQEITALKGTVHRPTSEDDAFKTLLGLFTQYEAEDYLAWDEEWLPLSRLNARLKAQGLTKQDSLIPTDSELRQQRLTELSALKIGLTGTLGGLADSGSIIVQSGPQRGRLASLLPPVHIAFLKTDSIFPSMAHFFNAHPDAVQQASNLVFISGPSRTADIELTLTLGVHGPKDLHVVLV